MNPTAIADIWVQIFVNLCLQSTALLICTAAAQVVLRKSSAAIRHQLAMIAVIGLLILPTLAFVAPIQPRLGPNSTVAPSLTLSPNVLSPAPSAHEAASVGSRSQERATAALQQPASSGASVQQAHDPIVRSSSTRSFAGRQPSASGVADMFWSQPRRLALPKMAALALFTIWLAGCLALFLKQGVTAIRLLLLAHRCELVADQEIVETLAEALQSAGLRRPVRLLRAASMASFAVPATWGVVRPVIVLPRNAARWPTARLRSVLVHEIAHIKRGDWLAQAAATLACTLYWFHPMAWLLARRMAEDAELACDQFAIRSGIAPTDYAGHLLDIVRSMPRAAAPAGAVSMARGSYVGTRLRAILEGREQIVSWKWSGVATVISVTAIVAAAFIRPLSAEPARQPAQPVSNMDSIQYICVQSCLLPVAGPGVNITLQDSALPRRGDSAALGIIHDQDISLIINTLKSAGAEAIAIGDQRVGISTVVRASGAEVTVNGVRLQPPYNIRAIGKPELLLGALNSPGGGIENLMQIDPAMAHLERAAAVELPALANPPERKWMHTVPDANSAGGSDPGAIESIRALAAYTDVTGPGVKVTLRDGSGSGRQAGANGHLIIHDRDITAVLDQLREAGAEAIAINRIRITATMGVRGGSENFIGTNERLLTAPYVIRAIGDPARMLRAVNQANGAADQIKHTEAGMVQVERDESLSLPAGFQQRPPHVAHVTVPLAFQAPHSGGPSGRAVTLPGGVTVELIAVGAARDSDGGDWWKPDGTPLSEEPVRTSNRFLVSTPGFGSQYLTRYLFLRMKGPADGDVSTTGLIVDPTHHLDTEGLHHGRDLRVNDAHLIQETPATGTVLMAFPKSEKRCTYRFGVAAGPWETIAVIRPDFHADTATIRRGANPPMIYLNNRPQIYISDSQRTIHTQSLLDHHAPLGDVARRVVALDRDGREIRLFGESIDSYGEQMLNVSWAKYARIAEIRLQTRPYQWAEFCDIVLQPRHSGPPPIATPAAQPGYMHKFACGMTISVLGVTERPSDGGKWWLPSGKPLAGPIREFQGKAVFQYADGSDRARAILVQREYGVPPSHVGLVRNTYTPSNPPTYSEATEYLPDMHAGFDGVYHIPYEGVLPSKYAYGDSRTVVYPPEVHECTYRIGVAAGPWQTIGTVAMPPDVKGISTPSELSFGDISCLLPARPTLNYTSLDGNRRTLMFLPLGNVLGNTARRIVAVDKSGKVIPLNITGSGNQELGDEVEVRFTRSRRSSNNLDRASIKEFRLQTRPYEWAEFKNIRLEPGRIVGAKR